MILYQFYISASLAAVPSFATITDTTLFIHLRAESSVCAAVGPSDGSLFTHLETTSMSVASLGSDSMAGTHRRSDTLD